MTEREAGARLANSLVSESIVDYLELSEEYSVSELNIPLRWVGHSLDDLKVRNTYDISVMAIRRGGAIIIRIDPYAPLQSGDVLVVIGGNDDIQKIANLR
jgi:trk system potassium uptake protein TrkA